MSTHVLEEKLNCQPRFRLLSGETPLELMEKMTADPAHRVYFKRDDLTGLGPGGNKTRSLEFLIGDALAKKADRIVAAGPAQSNLCTLAAAAACRAGLPCTLFHNGVRPEHATGNELLNRLYGVESVYLGEVPSEEREISVAQFTEDKRASGENPYRIVNGASNGIGALGYAAALLELRRQCSTQGIQNMTIFAPGGNGGVASGLIYGNALTGDPFRIVVVSVEDPADVLQAHIESIVKEIGEVLELPMPGTVTDHCEITDAYRGEGWGCSTPESAAQVLDMARKTGVLIENIYTSKPVVCMLDYLRRGKITGDACFLHTGGFGSLFSQY